MKRADASRPGLSLPTRLGVLALATMGGVIATVSILAKQNGTDVMSSLATLDFAKAYSKENLNYTLADAKLKLGDRKGAAALIKTLPFTEEVEGRLSYKELRQALVKAQLVAKEFTEALQSAQDDRYLQIEVLVQQKQVQGLDATLKNASTLSEPARSTALVPVALEYAGQGDMTTTESLLPQLLPTSREGIYQSLVSAYYKGGKLDAALGAVRRITDSDRRASALSQLGSSCLNNKDVQGLQRVLEEMPAKLSVRKQVAIVTKGSELRTTEKFVSQRHILLQQAAYSLGSPSEALELVQRYAHPSDLPELVRGVCSAARSNQDHKTVRASLALLRSLTSEEGKRLYDQEAQQLFYSDTYSQAELLALALTLHSDQTRLSVLQNLAQKATTVAEFKPILASLRKISTPSDQNVYDSAIMMFMNRAEQESPAQAKVLAQQILDPERRKQLLASLAARHP